MTARERLGTGGPPAPATGGASSSDVPGDARRRRPRLERIAEGLALALLGVLTYAIAGAFQIFERLAAFFTAYEHIQLDELVTAGVVVGGALALRRRSQARREVAEGRRAGQTLSTEVAERQRAERALAANEQRLSTLVANAPVILFALDPAGRFTFCEGRGLAALGLRPGQAVGQSALQLYRDVPRVVADVRRALAGEAFACAREINGRWFETNYRPVHDTGGAVSGVILVATDVTDRKHFEAALKEARDAALAASRAKSAFLANMSHEIRTPMNAFLGMVDLLADTPLTPEQQEYVDISRRAGDALLGVIDDILDLSKVEAGLLELEATDFDLLELVRETAAVLSGPVRAKGLALTYELAVGVPPRVRGDAQRLRQVLLNLLGNAVKFTERGAVALTVESFPQPSVEWGGSSPLESSTTLGASYGTSLAPPLPSPLPDVPVTLRFAVRDTGIGIAADKLDSIFNAFSQVDASTTRRYGGTGLGLAIVERLVGLMGGRVAVESVYGQGSTFAFSVPLWPVGPLVGAAVDERAGGLAGRSVGDTPAAASLRVAPPVLLAPVTRRLRLLLVDDSADNRRLVALYLKDLPYAVETATDGQAGLDAFRSGAYDLVLMDVHMPVLDGLAATRTIRAWEGEQGRAPTPILALTASAMAEDVQQALVAGCDAHVAKPVKKATLLEAIARFTRDPAPLVASVP